MHGMPEVPLKCMPYKRGRGCEPHLGIRLTRLSASLADRWTPARYTLAASITLCVWGGGEGGRQAQEVAPIWGGGEAGQRSAPRAGCDACLPF